MLRQWMSASIQQCARIFRRLGRNIQRLKLRLNLFAEVQNSTEYTSWQRRFLQDRLRLWGVMVLLGWILTAVLNYNLALISTESFDAELLSKYGHAITSDRLRFGLLVGLPTAIILPLLGLSVYKTRWGWRHPTVLFLGFSLSLSLPALLFGSFYRFPEHPPWASIFMAQAIFVPTCWQLHTLSQAIPITYYFVGYPLLGLKEIALSSRSILAPLMQ